MLKPEAGLFERARNSPSAGVLPRPDAPLDKLKQLGRVLCKAVLDEHPIGAGVGRFLFEFLVLEQTGERRVFDERRPRVALAALRDFDEGLAKQYDDQLDKAEAMLEEAEEEPLKLRRGGQTKAAANLDMLTLRNFDESVPEEEDVDITPVNLGGAVVKGCRHKLMLRRHDALRAVRDGFTFDGALDLTMQLAVIPCDEMLQMVQGKSSISGDDLVACFIWPEDGTPRPRLEPRTPDVSIPSRLPHPGPVGRSACR